MKRLLPTDGRKSRSEILRADLSRFYRRLSCKSLLVIPSTVAVLLMVFVVLVVVVTLRWFRLLITGIWVHVRWDIHIRDLCSRLLNCVVSCWNIHADDGVARVHGHGLGRRVMR